MKEMIKIDTDRFIETIADGIQDVFPYALDATAALEVARKITEAGDFVRELARLAQSVLDEQKKRPLCALEEMREPEEPHECWFEPDLDGWKYLCFSCCGRTPVAFVDQDALSRMYNAMRHLTPELLEDGADVLHREFCLSYGQMVDAFRAAAKAMRMGQ